MDLHHLYSSQSQLQRK
ncbi:hypothetical protein CRUP_012928 [Coryphaenoides rupestris]|nr:hypothetical protein CRUP_012928 [Coryphaenoides rupestris]